MFSRASADLIDRQLAAEDFTTAEQVYVATRLLA